MRPFPILALVLLALCVIPVVSADIVVTGGNIDIANSYGPDDYTAFTLDSEADEKISIIEFDLPIGTTVNFTLTYGTGSTVSGWMVYQPHTVFGQSWSSVHLGSDTWSETFIDAQVAGVALTKHVQFQSYAVNRTENPSQPGFALYAQGYGLFSDEIAFYPVDDIENNLIYRVSMAANNPVTVRIDTTETSRLQEFVTSTV